MESEMLTQAELDALRIQVQAGEHYYPPGEILRLLDAIEDGRLGMLAKEPYPITLIEWFDSKGITTAWEYIDELEPMPPTLCYSVGFLISETDQYVTIAQAVSDNQVLGRTTIPKCSIQKRILVGKPVQRKGG